MINCMEIIASGDSMLPTLVDGTKYCVEMVDTEDIMLGDVIVFCVDEVAICHRVIRKIVSRNKSVFFKTKGDNCQTADPFAVTTDMIVGRIIM